MEIIDERQFCRVALPEYQILDDINGKEMLRRLERIIRVCYKSEDKISDGSAERMVANIIRSGHTAMLEHENIPLILPRFFVYNHGIQYHQTFYPIL